MTIQEAKRILDIHSVASYRKGVDGPLMAEDRWHDCTTGENGSDWITCPMTRPALLAWLGY